MMMIKLNKYFKLFYDQLLSDKTREKSEQVILIIAIASFIVHLAVIYLVDFGIIQIDSASDLLKNPIAAIYTPFSFILIYEVYLLIYYIPKSFTIYISKQYEIITLIIIRRLFKDLANITFSENWFQINYDLQFTYDLVASVLLFFLIYLFYVQNHKKYSPANEDFSHNQEILRFIRIKKVMALALVPILFIIAIYSFSHWSYNVFNPDKADEMTFTNINNVFFEQFFTVLIFVDVILLLFSFFHTDEFHKVIRNSGFIISTILIRLSFSATGLLNTLLIVSAIIFGLLILFIHNRFEKHIAIQKTKELD